MTLAAGRLNKRVQLQSPVNTQDTGTGAVLTSWTTVRSVWAAIEPLSVRDLVAADARQSRVTARILLRAADDIDATWRVVHGARIYQIVGVLPDADTGLEYVTLAVAEGTNPAGS